MKFDSKIKNKEKKWSFDNTLVTKHFNNHILKSIPIYKETHQLIISYSDFFIKNNSTICDLGCSTGHLLNEIYKKNYNVINLKLIGIDQSKNMIKYCKRNSNSKIKFIAKKIEDYNFNKAQVYYCIYTLQFIDLIIRKKIIKKIYNNLNINGAFFLFEKIRSSNAYQEDMSSGVYNDFKINNGFSHEEIINKSISLRGILHPITANENLKLLKNTGFKHIETIFKYNNFVGYLAVKK